MSAPPPGGRSGSASPRRRLAVTPDTVGRSLRRLSRPPSTFPLAAASWPGTVARPVPRSKLGAAYDTDWARRYPARFARVLLTELIARPMVTLVARPSLDGVDRFAHLHEPVIFAANHSSHLDTPLLLSVLPEPWRHRTVVAAGADYFFDTRAKAAASALAINAIPMERVKISRDSAKRAAALLTDGWSLLIFPEGGRSPDGWAQTHRAGAAWLSVRTGRAVVPVYLEGTRNIWPRDSTRLRPGSTRVAFGPPIRPGEGIDARELAARIERAISALADEQNTDWWSARRRAAEDTSPDLTGPAVGAWRRTWALGEGEQRRRADHSHRWPDR